MVSWELGAILTHPSQIHCPGGDKGKYRALEGNCARQLVFTKL
jgi:hypothetical protein